VAVITDVDLRRVGHHLWCHDPNGSTETLLKNLLGCGPSGSKKPLCRILGQNLPQTALLFPALFLEERGKGIIKKPQDPKVRMVLL
jgi:hypothetical protein